MPTLVDTPTLSICYDKKNDWLQAEWRGFHDNESVRVGCHMLLQYVEQFGCTKILNDSSEVLDGWQESTQWIGQEFFCRLHQAGVRAIAWVTAMDWPARTCVAATVQHAVQPAVATFEFDALPAAQKWLQEVA